MSIDIEVEAAIAAVEAAGGPKKRSRKPGPKPANLSVVKAVRLSDALFSAKPNVIDMTVRDVLKSFPPCIDATHAVIRIARSCSAAERTMALDLYAVRRQREATPVMTVPQ